MFLLSNYVITRQRSITNKLLTKIDSNTTMGNNRIASILLMFVLIVLFTPCIAIIEPVSAASEDSWATKASMHQNRFNLGTAVVNEKIYAIGGQINIQFDVTGTNEEYDPATNTWTVKAPMPTPRSEFGIAFYQNEIYCIGGAQYDNVTKTMTPTGVIEIYDPANDIWKSAADLPVPRAGIKASLVGDKIYLVDGGLNLTQVYDPKTDSWTEKSPAPSVPTLTSGWSGASVVVDNKIHLLCALPISNSNQIYDPSTDIWSVGKPLISGACYAGAGATTGTNAPKRIYVLGGSNVIGWIMFDYPNSVCQSYDPVTENWTVCTSMPSGRFNVAVAVVNDLVYAIGGWTPNVGNIHDASAVTEQYIPFGYGTLPQPKPEPFLTLTVIAVLAIAAVIIAGLLVTSRKSEKRKSKNILKQ